MRIKSILVLVTVVLIAFGLCGSTLIANVNDGLISHWRFDEGSGSVAYDSAGDNDGTLVNGTTWTTGQIGYALDFDGVDDYVEVPDATILDLEQEATLSAWINTRKLSVSQGIVGRWNYAGRPDKESIMLWTRGDYNNRFMFGVSNDGTDATTTLLFSNLKYSKNIWYHITGTYDGTTMRLYVNGESDNYVNKSGDIFISDTNWYIGTLNYAGVSYFDGIIDDVRVYGRALSADEIWYVYMSYLTETQAIDIKPGSCPNPLNVKSKGVLPVAILGTEDFDVSNIDIASIRLTGVAPIRSSYEDVATPVSGSNDCECSTEGPDGFLDLTLKFETQQIVDAIGEVNHGDELVLELTGVLSDETLIEGSDCIVIRGKHKPINPADINKDGVVNIVDFSLVANNWLQSSIIYD